MAARPVSEAILHVLPFSGSHFAGPHSKTMHINPHCPASQSLALSTNYFVMNQIYLLPGSWCHSPKNCSDTLVGMLEA